MNLGCHCLLDLPLDLLILVLVRLPHRQLVKCMFVSKSFSSIIRQPKFIEGYCTYNPICLLFSTSNTYRSCFRHSLYCCNLDSSGGDSKDLIPICINSFRRRGPERRYSFTQSINGLVFYYYDSYSVLVNVFSGELTILPNPINLPDTSSSAFSLPQPTILPSPSPIVLPGTFSPVFSLPQPTVFPSPIVLPGTFSPVFSLPQPTVFPIPIVLPGTFPPVFSLSQPTILPSPIVLPGILTPVFSLPQPTILPSPIVYPPLSYYLPGTQISSGCNPNPLKDLDPSTINANTFRGTGEKRHGVTEIINGLLCYYYDSCPVVVNVFSGEFTLLPSPIILPDTLSPVFYFGFDPINRIYKLLCCTKLEISSSLYAPSDFHILTIDGTSKDISWRKLPPFTEDNYYPNFYPSNSVSINGSLYWIQLVDWNSQSSKRIISFDLTTEKFRSFMPPDDAVATSSFSSHIHLVQFRGRLSILSFIRKGIIVIHTLDMGGNGNPHEWSKHTITVPDEFRGVAVSIGNLPDGNLLFIDLSTDGNLLTPVYAYIHETKKFVIFGSTKFPDLEIWRKIWRNILNPKKNTSHSISVVQQTIGINALINQFCLKERFPHYC